MADKYVRAGGTASDSNTGNDDANAYRTIQKGVDEVGSEDTLYIRYGEYDESIVLPAKDFTIICDLGTVIRPTGSAIFTATSRDYHAHIYNAEYAGQVQASGNAYLLPQIYNSVVDSIYSQSRMTDGSKNTYFEKTIFKNRVYFAPVYARLTPFVLVNCTVLPYSEAFTFFPGFATPSKLNCVNVIIDRDVNLDTNDNDFANNIIYFENCCITGSVTIDGTAYTLAEVEALYPSQFVNCFDNPAYLDANYCPKPGSPCIDNGKGGSYETYVGARKPANNYNAVSDLFVGATFMDAEYSTAYGGFVRNGAAGTPGVITTNVLDYGAAQNIRNVYLQVTQSWPTDVVDSDNSNIPNTLTFEYRVSNTSAADCELQSWVEVESWEDLDIDYRYWQFKFTLIDDGVAA